MLHSATDALIRRLPVRTYVRIYDCSTQSTSSEPFLIGFLLADFALSLFFLSFLALPMHRPVGRTDGEYEQEEEQESPTHPPSLSPSNVFLFLSLSLFSYSERLNYFPMASSFDSTRLESRACLLYRPSVPWCSKRIGTFFFLFFAIAPSLTVFVLPTSTYVISILQHMDKSL